MRFVSKYFILFKAIVSNDYLKFSVSKCLLPLYINKTDLCVVPYIL